jgi:hypothetical protein
LHGVKFLLWRKVRVSHSQLEVTVIHQLTHNSQIDAAHDELAGEIVPHIVPAEFLDIGFSQDGFP